MVNMKVLSLFGLVSAVSAFTPAYQQSQSSALLAVPPEKEVGVLPPAGFFEYVRPTTTNPACDVFLGLLIAWALIHSLSLCVSKALLDLSRTAHTEAKPPTSDVTGESHKKLSTSSTCYDSLVGTDLSYCPVRRFSKFLCYSIWTILLTCFRVTCGRQINRSEAWSHSDGCHPRNVGPAKLLLRGILEPFGWSQILGCSEWSCGP